MDTLASKKVIYLSPSYRFLSLLFYLLVVVLFAAIIYVDFILASIPIGVILLLLTVKFSHFIWNTKPQITLSERGMTIHFEENKTYSWEDISNEKVELLLTHRNYSKYNFVFYDKEAVKHTYGIGKYDISPKDFEELVSKYKAEFK